ncbi:DUF2993 domain-containing protein [Synechococcus sp. PCC 7336]|uniref:LmeA family phospholipid-binding protein n=1 Tax=Synechococcus sp. PCC 7336 TaxID=195250 RepID=UPI0003477B65|nr:DUF2993 domain-containing protein [Synechococcus sp. PCC 7336]
MEIFAGVLALLAGLLGTGGFLVDRIARDAIADELDDFEVLEVRVQSSPNLKLVGGRIDRLLLAGRGLVLEPFPRLELLELETDPVRLDLGGDIELRSPLRAAMRVAIAEEDINGALQSPAVLERFQDIEADLPFSDNGPEVFDLESPAVDFLGNNRVQLQVRLVPEANPAEVLAIVFTTEIALEEGQRLRLDDPEVILNDVPFPEEIVDAFTDGINRALDVSELEARGVFLRLLQLDIAADRLEVVGFLQIDSLDDI